jgi:hypothetical protein
MKYSAVDEIFSILRGFRKTINKSLIIFSIPFAHLAAWARDKRLDIIDVSMGSAADYYELELPDIRLFSNPR